MAWRFGNYHFVKQGTLDNTQLGRTTGEIEFADLGRVALDLRGDMQGNLLNQRIRFSNPDYDPNFVFDHGGGMTSNASEYMSKLGGKQIGEVGDIFGDPYLYIEWYSEANGRCVVELSKDSYLTMPLQMGNRNGKREPTSPPSHHLH